MNSRRVSGSDGRNQDADGNRGLRWQDRSRQLFLIPQPPVPRFFVRSPALEAKLDALLLERAVIWVCAPARTGKRAAISAWLDRIARPAHQVYWLRAGDRLTQRAALAPAVGEFLGLLTAAEPHRQGVAGGAASHARRRFRAAQDARRGYRHSIVVVDMGGHPLTLEQLGAFEALALQLPRLRLLVLTDGRPKAPAYSPRHPDVLWPDFKVDETSARDAFGAYDARAAFEELIRLGEGAASSGPVLGDYFEEVVGRKRERPEGGLRRARAQHLVAIAERTMPRAGARLIALFAVAPVIPEPVAQEVIDDPREFDQLHALTQRGLVELSQGEDGGMSFVVADELQEPIRRLSSLSYVQNSTTIHGWAAEAAILQKDFPRAISQYLQAGRPDVAARVFADHWDYCVQHEGGQRTRMLSMALPAESVFANSEAIAAVWLVHVVSPGTVPFALHQTKLLGMTDAGIAALSTRARVSVRTARALMLLRQGRYLEAEKEIRRASTDAVLLAATDAVHSEGLLLTQRLAAARIALWQGNLTGAAQRFGDISEELTGTRSGVFAFLALQGRLLADTLRGEFDVAERTLKQVEDLCFELKLEDTRLGAELLYCAVWLRDNEPAEVGLREVRQAIQLSNGTDDVWRHLLSYVDILLLMRKGDWPQAVQALRSLSRLLPSTRQELPLFDSHIRVLLGITLIVSGQAGEALRLIEGESDGIAHMPCFSTVRAIALVAQGSSREAIEATAECIRMHDHAVPYVVYAHAVRALAFKALGFEESAQQAYINALGTVVIRGIRADLRVLLNSYLEELDERAEEVAPDLVARARELLVPRRGQGEGGLNRATRGFSDLTTPEWETLRLLAGGESIAEIAESQYLNRNTLKSRTRTLYRKLGVRSRQEAVDLAVRQGVIRP